MFSIGWQDDCGVSHRDNFWTNQVNLWRDLLPAEIVEPLQGKTEGEKIHMTTDSGAFCQPYDERNVVEVKAERIRHPVTGEAVIPDQGRYYPQSFLQGVDGVYRVSAAPALCREKRGDRYIFDRNHPLAGYKLDLTVAVEQIHDNRVERGGRCEDWLERICMDGPGMQASRKLNGPAYLTARNLERDNDIPDSLFYLKPRMVQHLDAEAGAFIQNTYGRLIGNGTRVLDLMASWDSHLPRELELGSLTALGLNEEELRNNVMATATYVQDLNENGRLPFATGQFDAVICTASVEYLTNPVIVFREIERVLAPGGVAAIAFSNRWFAPKAIRLWSEIHEFERLGMVLGLFRQTPGFHRTESMTMRGRSRPDDDPHPEYLLSDPVYLAWSYKIK